MLSMAKNLETVYKQNLKTVGWTNQRLILTTHDLENFAHLTKMFVNVSLTNSLLYSMIDNNKKNPYLNLNRESIAIRFEL